MQPSKNLKSYFLPLLIFVAVFAAFFSVWLISQYHESSTLKNKTVLTTEQVAIRLEEAIRVRTNLVSRMRVPWRSGLIDDQDRFSGYAAGLMSEFPGLLAVNWIDSDGFIRWLVPEGPNKAAKDKDLKKHPTAAKTFLRAMDSGLPQITPPIDLLQGGKGLAAYFPIDGAKSKDGYLNAVFRVKPMVDSCTHDDVLSNFTFAIHLGDDIIYSDMEDPASMVRSPLSASSDFPVGDNPWVLTLFPRKSLISSHKTITNELILFFGIFLGLVLSALSKKYFSNQMKLADSEQRIRTMLGNVPAAIYRCNLDSSWTMHYMSSEVIAITGYPAADFIGNKVRTFASLIHPDDRTTVDDAVQVAVRNRGAYELVYRIIAKDQKVHWVHEKGRAHYDRSGEPLYLDGAIWDITARRRAEEELAKLRNYLSNIINSMPSILVGVDAQGLVTQWNDEAQRATGLSSREATGKPLQEVFPRMASEMKSIRDAMSLREPLSHLRQPYQADGETLYEDITVYPLVTNGVAGAVLRVDDVTDRVRIEEMMVQSEKMLSVGGLAAGMAHEINNPLAGMMQTADLLKRRLTLDLPANKRDAKEAGIDLESLASYLDLRAVPKMLENILSSGVRANKIVTDMLSFARQGNSDPTMCDIRELLDSTAELAKSDYNLKKNFDFRRIEIVTEYAPDVRHVLCETSKIQQVLLNLLRNGAEAMQERAEAQPGYQPRFIFRVNNDRDDGWINVEIEDNGPGMEEETTKRVFEPFFTTKPTNRGTGLGLSVSYFIIADNHGGEMSVESTKDIGTKFVIRLPVRKSLSVPPTT